MGNPPGLVAYADGSCIGNPGPGGWGVVLVGHDGSKLELSGADPSTTNNRMEITAAIEALRRLPAGVEITIRSDSQYLVKTMTLDWKRRENLDLWKLLDAELAARKVRWEWVRGHSGDMLNERADALARNAAWGRPLSPHSEPFLRNSVTNAPSAPATAPSLGGRGEEGRERAGQAGGTEEGAIGSERAAMESGATPTSPDIERISSPIERGSRSAQSAPGSAEKAATDNETEIARSLRPLLREGETLRRCAGCGRAFVATDDPPRMRAYCSLAACQLKRRSNSQN